MASSVFLGGGGTVSVDDGLSGDGSAGDPLDVLVDGVTITINGSNQLVGAASGAPTDAQYIVAAANGSLSQEVVTGTGVSTFLATPTSANLLAAVTNETGTGALVFGTSPALTTPSIVTSVTMPDDGWIGLGSGAGRIEFDDQTTDEVNFLNCRVGIATSTPTQPLEVVGYSLLGGMRINGADASNTIFMNSAWALAANSATINLGTGALSFVNGHGTLFAVANGAAVTFGPAAFGTGNFTGRTLLIGRNSSGSGAAGALAMHTLSGTPLYLWFDTTGALRRGTAPPDEDGTPADTSGVVIAGPSGLGTGVATFLATPSSLNLAAAVTGETGAGALVFASGPAIDNAILSFPILLNSDPVFAELPGSPAIGTYSYITDSNTATWGATVAGGGANTVLIWFNGTNWTVAGK